MSFNKFLLLNILLILGCFQANIAAVALKDFKFNGASVLPYTTWPTKTDDYFLLSREAWGNDKGTWDAFGGSKDANETHPVQTASREFAEETMYDIFKPKAALDFITLSSGNTSTIIANMSKNFVIYLTKFDYQLIENFVKSFYQTRSKLLKTKGNGKLLEKDKIAWVEKANLASSIINAKRNANGRLITPIKVWANIVQPDGTQTAEQINLRPALVGSLQSFFNNSNNYTLGKNSKIRFYKG